jgi:flagellar basal body rod protein FlgF
VRGLPSYEALLRSLKNLNLQDEDTFTLLRQFANDESGNYQIISNHTIVVPADNQIHFSQQGTIAAIKYGTATIVGAPKVK